MRGVALAKIAFLTALGFSSNARNVFAIGQTRYVETAPTPGSFPVVKGGSVAALYVDSSDWPGVVRAARDLQADIGRVTGRNVLISTDAQSLGGNVIIV